MNANKRHPQQSKQAATEPSRSWDHADRDELKVILDYYDLMLYVVQRCEKFRR